MCACPTALAGPKGLEEATLQEALLTLETKVSHETRPSQYYKYGSGVEICVMVCGFVCFSPQCQQSMARAVANEETLGIEYDEQTTCDVCRDVSASDMCVIVHSL